MIECIMTAGRDILQDPEKVRCRSEGFSGGPTTFAVYGNACA